MAVDATAPLPTLTPESIKRRRKLAEMMLAQGMDVSPIASPWQGAARLAQSLMGGIEIGMADKEERQGQASAAEAVAKILAGEMGGTGGSTPVAAAPAVAEPGNRSLPTFASDVTGGINQATAKYGLDPNYLPITAAIESGGNPNARNPRSSAGGLFQFINSTAGQYGLTNKFDPAASADAAARLAMDNKKALVAALGREPTPAELYLAHQQGAGGAAKLLANPDAPAVSIVGEKAVRLNGGSPNMTAAQFANKWLSKFNSYGPRTQVASANPGFVPMPYDPSNGAPAKTMPYDPEAQPQSGLVKPLQQQTAGLSIEAVPPQGIPTQAPEPPQTPVQPGSLPSMAGGGQAMQMPPEGLQQVAQAVTQQTARPEVRQAAQQAAQTPQGQQMIQQAQGAPIAAIMQALQNPWLNDGQRSLLMFVLKERMERNDPKRQLEMQRLQMEMENQRANAPMERRLNELKIQAAERSMQGEGAVPLTDDERKMYGIPRGQAAYKTRSGEIKFGPAGTTIKNEGTIPPGYQAKRDAEGNVISVEPIPGSKEQKAEVQRQAGMKASANAVVDAIDRIEKTMQSTVFPTTGAVGNLMSSMPGTAAHDVRSLVDTLEANIAFDKLNEMRSASPTGGALGSVTERELALLGASMANLRQSQSAEQFKQNLSRVKERYLDIIHGPGNRPDAAKPADAGSIKPGHVEDGYRFKGGNPGDAKNWEKVR